MTLTCLDNCLSSARRYSRRGHCESKRVLAVHFHSTNYDRGSSKPFVSWTGDCPWLHHSVPCLTRSSLISHTSTSIQFLAISSARHQSYFEWPTLNHLSAWCLLVPQNSFLWVVQVHLLPQQHTLWWWSLMPVATEVFLAWHLSF